MHSNEDATDLGFTLRKQKNGDVDILHHDRSASTLRGADALKFMQAVATRAAGRNHADAQQRMARTTGNYKHGNERTAKEHPRNRRQVPTHPAHHSAQSTHWSSPCANTFCFCYCPS